MLNAEDIKAGVPIATLGSIGILTASFLEKADFILNYQGGIPRPFTFFLISGLLLLLSSGAYLLYRYSEDPRPRWLYDYFFEFPLGIGLIGFFVSTIFTLIIYFR